MTVSAPTIWSVLLLAGCMLAGVHMTRPRTTRLGLCIPLVTGGLAGVMCASLAAIHVSAQW